MRGKGCEVGCFSAGSGITPEYAGKRNLERMVQRRKPDHPRVCGEKHDRPDDPDQGSGSPPRMRGKEGRRPCVVGVPGITPAYAGKSVINGSEWLSSRDHPRICGEKTWGFVQAGLPVGSPPHMRGKVRTALSGTTGKKDHPRICGEKCLRMPLILRHLGSPPHMRGKVLAALMPANRTGITPAYAGKSNAS